MEVTDLEQEEDDDAGLGLITEPVIVVEPARLWLLSSSSSTSHSISCLMSSSSSTSHSISRLIIMTWAELGITELNTL